MDGVFKNTSGKFRRHSICSYSNFETYDYVTAINSNESICLTPSCTRVPSLEGLMLAPQKKKPDVVTRRSSAPATSHACGDIRKRLDFDCATTDAPNYVIGGKRNAECHCNDLAIPFSDMELTPKIHKNAKLHDLDKYRNNFSDTTVCSTNSNVETPIPDSCHWMSKRRSLSTTERMLMSGDFRFTKTIPKNPALSKKLF